MGRIGGAFDRLSAREKVLVVLMLVLLVGSVLALAHLWVGVQVGELETRIEEDSDSLTKIYAQAGEYQESVKRGEATREMAERNRRLNLKLAINEVAKTISFDSRGRDGALEGQKRLADVVQFDQTQETFLSKKKKGRRKKGPESDEGYYRRDQPVALSDNVPFEAIYQFLERVEESDKLLFVTDIEMTRDYQDGRIARKNASFVVSTYYYKGKEE